MTDDKNVLIKFLTDIYLCGGLISLWLRFEIRDIWIGVYWDVKSNESGELTLFVYLCIVPLFPVIFKYDPITRVSNNGNQQGQAKG